jgi:hypothetical protein
MAWSQHSTLPSIPLYGPLGNVRGEIV